MAGIGIDVYLKGKGGGGATQRAKTKLSAVQSKEVSKIATKKSINVSAISSFITTGNMKPGLMLIPGMSKAMIIAASADRVVGFGAKIFEAHTGESVQASNIMAYSKTIASGGTNIIQGAFENLLFTEPRIRRENLGLEYNRQLYDINTFNDKNKMR